jgi:hypothetical protein
MKNFTNVYIDMEYRKNDVTGTFKLICVSLEVDELVTSFDLRHDDKDFKDFINKLSNPLFIAYNVAGAEGQALTQIMGHKWMLKTNWIDLWVEFKQYSLTHPDYMNQKNGITTALDTFEIPYNADKEGTREIILGNDEYTDAQMAQIIKYCEADVLSLRPLARKLFIIGQDYGVTLDDMIERGRYCRNVGVSQFCSRGFPMDKELTKAVFNNRQKLRNALSAQCNEVTGFKIYKENTKGRGEHKVFTHYSFSFSEFAEYLESKGLLHTWKRTEAGRLCMEEDYVDEMVSGYKTIIEPVYLARNTLKQLNSTDLSAIMDDDGYIRPDYWVFHQKTSRTSPKPAKGFIMNLCPWLRMLCRPAPGRALVTIDFKSQEVLVAAALAKDYSMLEDYLTDIYLGQGKKTGFIPKEATKKSHKTMRDGFKPVVLGTSFGMQAKSLSIHFYNFWKDLGIEKDLGDCESDAREFLYNHKESYAAYYDFIADTLYSMKDNGYIETVDAWKYFYSRGMRENSVKNLKMQGNGAAMTRRASNYCIEDYNVWVIPLHDAVYFECAESEAVELAKKVSAAMVQASIDTLGEEFGKHMGTATQIFTHTMPYYDKRGETMYRRVTKELGFPCPEEFTKPPEIENIHNPA